MHEFTNKRTASKGAPHPELIRKAKLLKDCPYFTGVKSAPLIQKQMIFLVLAGLKPGATALSGHEVETAAGSEIVPDDPSAVGAFLDPLGVAYHLTVTAYGTEAFVSLDPVVVDKLFRCKDEHEFGLLVGFPRTAVDAWRDDTLLPHGEEARLYELLGAADMPDFFRLSRDYATEEFAILRSWWDMLQAYGMSETI
ncbi:MAG: hypothetical protein M3R63_16585 [Actinomycetota bacterium]|jgi:hypothetical protein|nr:hypothetical protein [Actinomycetota bacterium]